MVSWLSLYAAQLTCSQLLVYYRLFNRNIGLCSNQPAFADNPYLGRVTRLSISPPRTVLQLKRRICNIEKIGDFANSTLHLSASSRSLADDGDRMLDALGCNMNDPVELVVNKSQMQRPTEETRRDPQAHYSTRTTFILW